MAVWNDWLINQLLTKFEVGISLLITGLQTCLSEKKENLK